MSTQEQQTQKSYKHTLNLPATNFPMKADLVRNEPARLAKWKRMRLYQQVLKAHENEPPFVLHDGPPFANADIHLGHVINKVLKDFVVRCQTMSGRWAPYVPGWDCHGLPIEHKIQEKVGPRLREMDKLAIRKMCFEHATKWGGVQAEQFQRLGILGDWERGYYTMSPEYEAETLEVFASFVANGLVYRKLKPVHWSVANRTALAEAELEYMDREDPSVWVEFPVENPGEFKARLGLREEGRPSLLIWTTTPWTLPANLAIAVNPEVEYDVVAFEADGGRRLTVVASKLREATFALRGLKPRVLTTVTGQALAGLRYVHPFVDRGGLVVTADYVTTEDGTGLVHTAPGHGEEDYLTGLANGLEIYCPVDASGRFDSSAPNWITGLSVWEANSVIIQKLRELGVLFFERPLVHSYPHDWRSKTPTIFRATEQWFVSLETPYDVNDGGGAKTIRQRALEATDGTTFYPAWGRQRLLGMLQSRPDWCISRQRAWGLPIPVFYNEQGVALLTPQSVRAVARAFARHGSDAWFAMSPVELLGDLDPGPAFPKQSLRKEHDIFDVWFESGSSWHGVLDLRQDLPDAPANLYLEGSDQHRGWFQLSLLSSLGATGRPPFREVLTHGFVVKPDGTKVSKSDREYVTAMDEVARHGADLLRLWTCSVDYQSDIRTSPEIISKFGDDYRKIRNTLRFLLGNLSDFDPRRAATAAAEVPAQSLDGWMLYELDKLVAGVRAEYDAYLTHRAFRMLYDFCAVQISAVYANAMKDRLYCELPDSPLRRRSQAVQWTVADALIRLLAPMIVFTADEAWEFLPGTEAPSVHLVSFPAGRGVQPHPSYVPLLRLRDEALLELDRLKREQGLNKATDAQVVYRLTAADRALLEPYGVDLADAVGAGSHAIEPATGGESSVLVLDRRNDFALCARSRKRTPDVGSDADYPDLSARDAAVMRARQSRS